MKFECIRPWGSSYAEHLMAFLDEHGIPYQEDPRTDGSDCYGILISKNKDALLDMRSDLQDIMNQIDEDEENEDELWEKAWNLSHDDVQEISTDWKHLEIYDHPEALEKVGVRLDILWENHDPPYLIALSLIE